VDLNGDGARDILSGSYSHMETPMAGIFQVLWGAEDGTFKKAAPLTGLDGKNLIIPIKDESEMTLNICTRPSAVDWDGDGDLDLVVGNFAGSFYLFNGQGKGGFDPAPQRLTSGEESLQIAGAHSDPFPIDWDGDGDIDLISGSNSGGVYIAENEAGPGKAPQLKPFAVLIPAGQQRDYGAVLDEKELTAPGASTRVWVDDVNGDGKLDVLVGDRVTLISPVAGLDAEAFKKKQADWQEKFNAASAALGTAKDEKERNEANQKYLELYNSRSEFMTEEMTGFVWLYTQK
jgi:hypothetical protein